jgi:predicted MFS family arabinose efflux permease
MSSAAIASAGTLSRARWALLFGNFVIGCGVFVVAGTLNDISRSLQVSVPLAGQLIAIGGAMMCFGAPLLAGWVSGFDRRRLLAWTMLWYAAGHALCALMPSYAALWPLRAATVLGAAVFTPQAAAAMGFMAPPEQRGRAITFIFLGWSVASVLGMPLAAWLGEVHGWRVAFGAVAALSVLAAWGVFTSLPDGVKPAALSLKDWKAVLTHPLLMLIIMVTALQSAGQFTVFSYMAPYYRQVLQASPAQITLLFAWFGAFGLIGNLLLTRHIERIGANRAVALATVSIALSLLLWPLAIGVATMVLVLVPWALGCFSANSAQQARLNAVAPALASALMALNSSAMYLGQALGATGGGWLIARGGYAPLSWVGLVCLLAALTLSLWLGRRSAGARA